MRGWWALCVDERHDGSECQRGLKKHEISTEGCLRKRAPDGATAGATVVGVSVGVTVNGGVGEGVGTGAGEGVNGGVGEGVGTGVGEGVNGGVGEGVLFVGAGVPAKTHGQHLDRTIGRCEYPSGKASAPRAQSSRVALCFPPRHVA